MTRISHKILIVKVISVRFSLDVYGVYIVLTYKNTRNLPLLQKICLTVFFLGFPFLNWFIFYQNNTWLQNKNFYEIQFFFFMFTPFIYIRYYQSPNDRDFKFLENVISFFFFLWYYLLTRLHIPQKLKSKP